MRVPVPERLLPADELGTVHFVGIGGAGLSGIARIMLARGITVSGSDAKESTTLEALRALGATCFLGHDAANLGDADTVVVSTAVRENNPEVVAAVDRGLRLLPRSAALESVMQGRGRGRGGRHPRQDHHDLVADRGPPALRRRPVLRDRGRPQRDRLQRPRRQRRAVRRRGRRERRRLPRLLAARRAGHQRRGRPPRQLRHPRGLPRGVRHLRRPGVARRVHGGVRRRSRSRRAGPYGGRPRPGRRTGGGGAPTPTCAPRTSASTARPRASRWSTAGDGSAR